MLCVCLELASLNDPTRFGSGATAKAGARMTTELDYDIVKPGTPMIVETTLDGKRYRVRLTVALMAMYHRGEKSADGIPVFNMKAQLPTIVELVEEVGETDGNQG